MPTTPRLALPYPQLSSPADVPADMGALATALDIAAIFGSGAVGSRPTSTPGTPGITGRYYYATDQNRLYLDHGTGWILIGGSLPRVRVYQPINSAIGSGANTIMTFANERFDSDGMHAAGANQTRLTAQTKGLYLIGATITWQSNNSATREISIRLNGGGNQIGSDSRPPVPSALSTKQQVKTIWEMNVGDYVELNVYQNTGVNLNVEYVDRESPEFWMTMLHPIP